MGTKINTDMTLRMIKINQILTIDSITKKNIMEDKFFYNEEEWVKAIKNLSKSSIERNRRLPNQLEVHAAGLLMILI
jgi:hypothetical protein